ncbi:MAG: AAA family ATPase [Candidatus Micrarchaeia archaeon]
MIDYIELKGWKTHANTRIEFRKGTNVLIGIMGAGKSSVMDAISFALFGTFPALKQKKVSLEGVIMSRPEQKKSAEVRLAFTINGNEYVVTRKIERGAGSSASLEKNGKHLQTQPERVNEEIEKALGMNFDTFSRAIYAEQNKLDYMLELRKGDRKKQIDEMLNLDRFARAEENTTSLINNIKNAIADEEQMVGSIDVSTARGQLESMVHEKEKTESSINALGEESKKSEKEAALLKAKLEGYKKEYERRKLLSEELNKIGGKISSLKSEIEKISAMKISMQEAKAEAERLEVEIANSSKEFDAALREEKETERKLGELHAAKLQQEKKIEEKKKLAKRLEGIDQRKLAEELESKSKEFKVAGNAAASAASRKKEEEKWLKELLAHMDVCPLCRQSLSEELREKLIQDRKSEIAKLEAGAKEAVEKGELLEKEISKLQDELNAAKAAAERLKEYEGVEEATEKLAIEEEAVRKMAESAAKQAQVLSEELEQSRKRYGEAKLKLDYAHRLEAYKKELEEEQARQEKLGAELRLITIDEKAIYEIQEILSKESSKLSELLSKLAGEKKYLESVLKQIDEKAAEIAKFEAMKERIEQRKAMVADLNKFKSALVDAEALLRSSLVESVNALMQDIWPKLYPYGDFGAVRLSAEKDDYVLEINAQANGSNNWVEVESIASGGERSITALVLRIALSMVIVPNLRWLILDEPTHNLDKAGISKLVEVLGNTLPGVVEQVFIITHDESLKEISPAAIYMLDRDKASNGATTVGEIA